MRSFLADFELTRPRDLAQALSWRQTGKRPFAGGTDLMVLLEAGKLPAGSFFDLWSLSELRGITETPSHIRLGALTTYSEVRENPWLRSFILLTEAARQTGAIAIQNRGTLGGNIANASPAADSPPVLLVYEAEIELSSLAGSRSVLYRDFHLDYKKTAMRPDELITAILLPKAGTWTHSFYRKVGTRLAQAISKICLAAVAQSQAKKITDVRLAMGAVAPIPKRLLATENLLRGKTIDEALIAQAQKVLLTEISPIDDIRSDREYRSVVAQNVLAQFLRTL